MQTDLETTLATLVSMPSLTDDSAVCHEILHYILDELKTYDLFIETDFDRANPWILATTQNTRKPEILLSTHLDVLPAPDSMFHMTKRDGILYGRGVFDMKLAAACYLQFIRTHADILHELNIGFLFNTDEEKICASMPDILGTGLRPKIVLLPDGGDNWAIERRAKGFYGIELIATGKTAHGSRPWEGQNALHTLLDALQPLRERYTYKDENSLTFMVNSITSGKAFNQLPDHASALLDFRCFNTEELHECHRFVDDIVEEYGLTLNVLHSGDAMQFNEASPHVQKFLQSYRIIKGREPTYTDSFGGSDARFYIPLNIPCIVVEPNGGGRHANNEWVEAEDIQLFYKLIEHWALRATAIPLSPKRSEKSLV